MVRLPTLLCVIALALSAGAERVNLDLREKGAVRALRATPGETAVRQARREAGASVVRPLAVGDELSLRLFDDVALSLRLCARTRPSSAGETFLATSAAADGAVDAVVVQTSAGLQVDVQAPAANRVYTIASDASATVVREFAPAADESVRCQAPEPELTAADRAAAALGASGGVTLDDEGLVTVDVLVAYDTGAASYAASRGGLTNFATVAVAKMNTALANNGLSESFAFRLAGVTEATERGTDVEDVLYALRDGTGGWAAVKAAREAFAADVVTTLIDTGSAYGTTGIGWALNDTDFASFASYAYNVCAIRAVELGHTMTHEVGHNMGAGHATAVNPSYCSPGPQLFGYSAGHYFTGTDSVKYHTVMAYNADGYGSTYTSAPLFSTAEGTWAGVTAGDHDHDNARTLAATYAAVSQWRTPPEPEDDTRAKTPTVSPATTVDEGSATIFSGSLTVTLAPAAGSAGRVYYTTDGCDPAESGVPCAAPFVITRSTLVRAIVREAGKKPSRELRALYLERHEPILPGEWTTDVDGAQAYASVDGRLIVAMRSAGSANVSLLRLARSREFLAWAAVNGVYLVLADEKEAPDAQTAIGYFNKLYEQTELCRDLDYEVVLPTLAFALPDTPETALGAEVPAGDLTVEGLIDILAAALGVTVPAAPQFDPDKAAVKKFPFWLEMIDPNGDGEIHYTTDGTLPTAVSGMVYSDFLRIREEETKVTAATWVPGCELSSPFVIRTYHTKANRGTRWLIR